MITFQKVSSDWHFMHERIREYCPDFRGHYRSREEMTEDMIRRLNEGVAPGETLLFLGDSSLNHNEAIKAFNKLHFGIYWIPGNHCKIFKGMKGWQKTREMTLQQCSNVLGIYDELVVDIGRHKVLASHFPWIELSDERHGIKYAEYRPSRKDYPGVSFQIHGHVHSTVGERLRDRALDCGWDAWGRPVDVKEIEEIINARDSD